MKWIPFSLAFVGLLLVAGVLSGCPYAELGPDGGSIDDGPDADVSSQQDFFEDQPDLTSDVVDDTDAIQPTDVVVDPIRDGSLDLDAGQESDPVVSDVHEDLPDSADISDVEPDGPEPNPLPTFEHIDQIIDIFRGSVPTWVALVYVQFADGQPRFGWVDYDDTLNDFDFWPASTIKIYTVTATLELLLEYGFSLDATATFYHRSGEDWVEDITVSFRQMIFDIFDHSSNSDYTLLLRFGGVDWLNTDFFTSENGFDATALMRPYVSNTPYRYDLDEEQRIVIEEGDRSEERIHSWSGVSYADVAGCTVYNSTGTANCSTPRDMAEHMRRIMFHEHLDSDEQFDVRTADLDWLRYGDEDPVLNDPEASWAAGVMRVLPGADYYHKAGRVTDFALDLHYVDDASTDTHYIAAIATESTSTSTYQKLSEEIARMVLTPSAYVHLDYLADNVNPVTAELMVFTDNPGTLELIIKDYDEDAAISSGWTILAGTTVDVGSGTSSHSLASDCLAEDDKVHIRGRFTPDSAELPISYSDLHYVIIDADVSCP